MQEGDGEWEVLRAAPGLNGFLNILMCLRWWYGVMETPSDSQRNTVADVKWALQQMVGPEQTAPDATKRLVPVQKAAQVPAAPNAAETPAPAHLAVVAPPNGAEVPMPASVDGTSTTISATEPEVPPARTGNNDMIAS
ncbi:hypothetical protein C8R45DRAFT_934200 [Mycena sanguinolenta]|nr:hypothetical protein C8R45DRAFT_934200 [Mycena sanguinolenta]